MRRARLLPLVLVVAACAGPAARPAVVTPVAPPEGSFAIVDVRVFDGERTHEGATVMVREGRIAAVGGRVVVPAGLPRVDGRGLTVLPGLIDAHVHAFGEPALEQAMRFGVTTVVDMFGDPRFAAGVRAARGEGRMARIADLHAAGILATAPGGHGTQYGMQVPTLTAPEQADAWVRARIAEGSDFIKIIVEDGSEYGRSIPSIDPATLRALVEAAHRHGRLAVVHVSTHEAALDAVHAGADGLAHLFYDHPAGAELAALTAERGVFVIPTLTVLESATVGPSGLPLLEVPALAAYLGLQQEAQLRAGFPLREGGEARFRNALGSTAALHAAGVRIVAGSDAPNPGTSQGVSIHRELELLVRAGLTPQQALHAATAAAADAFGLADRGRIASGQRADLVLVRGDPTSDVTASREIVHVWKAGIAADREGPRAQVAAERAARNRLAAAAEARPGLLSDFEDAEAGAAFGAGWSVSTDQMAGGSSTASMTADGTLVVEGELGRGASTWSGVMLSPGAAPMQPADLSAYRAIAFRARGDGRPYRLLAFTRAGGMMPVVRDFAAGTEWTEVVVPLADLGAPDGRGVTAFVWSAAGAPGSFRFELDDVRLVPHEP